MRTESLVTWVGLAIGAAVSAWLIPGQWDLVLLVGFVTGLITSELSMRIERRRPALYAPEAKLEPQISVNGVRGLALGIALVAGAAFALQAYAEVTRWAPASIVSLGYFMCSVLVGVALHMLVNAGKLAQKRAPDWPSSEEAVR